MWREYEDSASKTVVCRPVTDRHTDRQMHTNTEIDMQTNRQNRLYDSCQSGIGDCQSGIGNYNNHSYIQYSTFKLACIQKYMYIHPFIQVHIFSSILFIHEYKHT